jgi:Family of unknown function (DUF6002)
MVAPSGATGTSTLVSNALRRYDAGVRAAARFVDARRDPRDRSAVATDLPEPGPDLERFTDVTDIALTEIDADLYLLDLMRNPGTRTTKTMASLLMVARAVRHTRETGERMLLVTPSSGNKANALQDAVARAYATGLATPDDLRVAIVVPRQSRHKLRGGPLSRDLELRRANPIVVADVDRPAGVKELTAAAVDRTAQLRDRSGFRCWYTLDLDNYRIADAARAYAEADLLPITQDSPPRWHAHAVSSAYGLLGYHLGHHLLSTGGYLERPAPAWHPGFLLVQQLATPDMVVSLLDRPVPTYRRGDDRLWHQAEDPAFPAVTDDPAETLDATFYTKAPPTSREINPLVARHGGGGVVVSKRECLDRFADVRALASHAGIDITPNPEEIREWSLVKVLTGVLVARERGLVPAGTQIVAHASGYYTDEMLPAVPAQHTTPVRTTDELATVLAGAASA